MTIINGSGWGLTTEITLHTKHDLVQGLIYDEVVGKRERHIRALRRGLERLGVFDMILKYPDQTRELFLHQVIKIIITIIIRTLTAFHMLVNFFIIPLQIDEVTSMTLSGCIHVLQQSRSDAEQKAIEFFYSYRYLTREEILILTKL